MKAIVYTEYGPPEVLKVMETKRPVPKDNQILIKVKASAVNVTDYTRFVNQLDGEKTPISVRLLDTYYLKAMGKIPGGEASGIVEEVGKNVKRFKKGDEIFGITADILNAWAEFACADETMVYEKPSNLSFEEAAVTPTTGMTALNALRTANLKKGSEVLIYGASGGVGLFAVQLAKAMGGIVTAVCSTRNVELVRSMGADYVIDYKKEDFRHYGKKYDGIIAINGYNSIATYKKLLKDHGTYVAVGGVRQGIEGMALGPVISLGSSKSFRFAPYAMIKDKGMYFLDNIKEMAENGKFKPYIDRTYPVGEVAQAIRYIIKDHAQGRVAITMDFDA